MDKHISEQKYLFISLLHLSLPITFWLNWGDGQIIKNSLPTSFQLCPRVGKHHRGFRTSSRYWRSLFRLLFSYCARLLAPSDASMWSFPRECLISLAWCISGHLSSHRLSASFSEQYGSHALLGEQLRYVQRPGLSLRGLNNELIY